MKHESPTDLIVTVFVGVLLLAGATAGAVPASPEATIPFNDPVTDLLSREDPDGGQTYQVLIDDPSGSMVHVEYRNVPSPFVQSVVSPVPDEVDQALAEMGIDEFGVYSNLWPDEPSIATHGVYIVTTERGLERFPVFIAEGTTNREFMEFFRHELLMTVVPLLVNQAPYALNYVMPTSLVLEAVLAASAGPASAVLWDLPIPVQGAAGGDPDTYPRLPDQYRDYPILYLWHGKKTVGPEEVWQGWYIDRTGETGGEGEYAYNERRLEFGPAVRTLGETVHEAGLYLNEKNERWARSTSTYMESRLTVGATSQGIDIPMATVEASDEREDDWGNFAIYPQYQRTGYALGVETPAGFVPLIGTYTEAETDWSAYQTDDTVHKRTTSVGVFVLGEYEPLVGFQYIGQEWPMDVWILFWVLNGGPGSDFVGDWEFSVGIFVLGEYEPVTGAQYRDSFDEARWDYQMMIMIGVFTQGEFRPLIGLTYDGKEPLLPNLQPTQKSWLVSAGVFVLEDYAPLVGVSFEPHVEGSDWTYQETYRVGVFPGDYDQFIPLAMMTYEGQKSSPAWLVHVPLSFGSEGADFNAAVGASIAGEEEPVAGVQYRPSATTRDYSAFFTAGVFVMGSFVPVAGIAYCSDAPGVLGMQPESEPTILLGPFVNDEFLPLLRLKVEADPDVALELLPSPVCG